MSLINPLRWPAARPRTKNRMAASFKVSPVQARKELYEELERLGATKVVITTDAVLRLDGQIVAVRRRRSWPCRPRTSRLSRSRRSPHRNHSRTEGRRVGRPSIVSYPLQIRTDDLKYPRCPVVTGETVYVPCALQSTPRLRGDEELTRRGA